MIEQVYFRCHIVLQHLKRIHCFQQLLHFLRCLELLFECMNFRLCSRIELFFLLVYLCPQLFLQLFQKQIRLIQFHEYLYHLVKLLKLDYLVHHKFLLKQSRQRLLKSISLNCFRQIRSFQQNRLHHLFVLRLLNYRLYQRFLLI